MPCFRELVFGPAGTGHPFGAGTSAGGAALGEAKAGQWVTWTEPGQIGDGLTRRYKSGRD